MLKEEKLALLPWYNKCKLISEYSYAGVVCFLDKYPVTDGHMLFVPLEENININFCFARAYRIGEEKVKEGEWDGFNIGLNYNEVAGQTIKYPHVHLIPRRNNDVNDPTGGVRGVIPSKQNWRKAKCYKNKIDI